MYGMVRDIKNNIMHREKQRKTQECIANLLGYQPRQCGCLDKTRLLVHSLICSIKLGCSCNELSSCHIRCGILPHVTPSSYSLFLLSSPTCGRLAVTVSSLLITVPLSHNCRSKNLSSYLSFTAHGMAKRNIT